MALRTDRIGGAGRAGAISPAAPRAPLVRRRRNILLTGHVRTPRPTEFDLYLATLLILVAAFCYKLLALGILCFLVFGTGLWRYRRHAHRINLVLVLMLANLADATVTAFMVSTPAGIVRTVQFLIMAAGLVGLFLYSWELTREQVLKGLAWLSIVSAAIFVHMVIYHVSIGKIVIWKSLYDTKNIISFAVFLLFVQKERIQRYVPFPLALAIALGLVLMSAERKAFLLLAVCLVFSSYSLLSKLVAALGVAAALLTVYVTDIDGGLLRSRVLSSSTDYADEPERYFFTVENIGARSDIVRAFVNRNATRLFHEHPVFGMGSTGYFAWARRTYQGGFAMNVHGELHRVPVEQGLVGIAIVLLYLAVATARTFHYGYLGQRGPPDSLRYAPFLLVCYAVCYAFAEAADTSLMTITALAGLVAARVPPIAVRDVLRARPSRRLGSRDAATSWIGRPIARR